MKHRALSITVWILLAGALVFLFAKTWNMADTRMLPYYLFRTFLRIALTYFLCLLLGITIGVYIGMRPKLTEIALPFLEILQALPLLGFLPMILVLFIRAFNESILGLEISSMVLLFLSMVWCLLFGVIAGVKSIPPHVKDLKDIFRMSKTEYFRHVILPSIYPPLIASSDLAFGIGWYFSVGSEIISYNRHSYNLLGMGYYLYQATMVHKNVYMIILGILILSICVWLMDNFVWNKLEEMSQEHKFLALTLGFRKESKTAVPVPRETLTARKPPSHAVMKSVFRYSSTTLIIVIVGLVSLAIILEPNILLQLGILIPATFYSFMRITIAYVISAAIALCACYLIFTHPRVRETVLSIMDVVCSVPHLALAPVVLFITMSMFSQQVSAEISTLIILVLGMVWCIMIYLAEAVAYLPGQLNDLARNFHIDHKYNKLQYARHFLIPALFPALIMGSMLAFAQGWNVIVATEYVVHEGVAITVPGVGSTLQVLSNESKFAMIIVTLVYMAGFILLFNYLLWKPLLQEESEYNMHEELE